MRNRGSLLFAFATIALVALPSLGQTYGDDYPVPPPTKISTTLNLDGDPVTISMFGHQYRGVAISHIGPKGIADSIGISPGDVLLSLNTKTIVTPEQADVALRSCPTGDLEIVFARRTPGGYKLKEKVVNYINPLVEFSSASTRRVITRDTADIENQLYDLINADRHRYNPQAPRVEKSKRLAEFARKYAQDMVKRNFFSHTDPDGHDFQQRAFAGGLDYVQAENLAEGGQTAEDIQKMFMNEPDGVPGNHRSNILNPQFLYAGIAIVRRPDDSLVVVEEFSTFSPDSAPSNQPLELDLPPGAPGPRGRI